MNVIYRLMAKYLVSIDNSYILASCHQSIALVCTISCKVVEARLENMKEISESLSG